MWTLLSTWVNIHGHNITVMFFELLNHVQCARIDYTLQSNNLYVIIDLWYLLVVFLPRKHHTLIVQSSPKWLHILISLHLPKYFNEAITSSYYSWCIWNMHHTAQICKFSRVILLTEIFPKNSHVTNLCFLSEHFCALYVVWYILHFHHLSFLLE